MLGRHHHEATLCWCFCQRERDLGLVGRDLSVGCVVDFDDQRLSTRNQFRRTVIPEVERLSSRSIDGFHRCEMAMPCFLFLEPHEDVGVTSSLLPIDSNATWVARYERQTRCLERRDLRI